MHKFEKRTKLLIYTTLTFVCCIAKGLTGVAGVRGGGSGAGAGAAVG
jgi:hypothetical protein